MGRDRRGRVGAPRWLTRDPHEAHKRAVDAQIEAATKRPPPGPDGEQLTREREASEAEARRAYIEGQKAARAERGNRRH